MGFDAMIKSRISPFLPQNYIDKGRILSLLIESLDRAMAIVDNRGETTAEEVEHHETQIHYNVQEIALALTGKRYIVKKEKP